MYQIYQELMRARGRQQVHLNALCISMPVLHSRHNALHCMIYRSYIIIYIIIYDHISWYTELHFNTVAAFYSCHNTFHCMINSALLSCSTPPLGKNKCTAWYTLYSEVLKTFAMFNVHFCSTNLTKPKPRSLQPVELHNVVHCQFAFCTFAS